ncbi:sigma factor [Streptomyces sp. NPDC052301]|uniref:sigma factor n=1 Tax=Streptomyces sp. NPDC052301 TaxID=3365687 RepID=UPI0037D7E7D7
MGPVVVDAASVEFHAFFERHYAELARLAYRLTGETDVADDRAADALLALRHRWGRVGAADHPVAYARGVVANLARTRIRSAVRERRRIALFWSHREERTEGPDVAGTTDGHPYAVTATSPCTAAAPAAPEAPGSPQAERRARGGRAGAPP